jgi:hypothetical protein
VTGFSYSCTPPQPASAGNCSTWHTGPVELIWDWNHGTYDPAPLQGSDCTSPRTFTADAAGTRVMCAVWNKNDPTDIAALVATVNIDASPPTVTGYTADRGPDHDGWWNHPVALQFNASDATSGISGCDVITYGGPDGDKAPVTGGCRDIAGNAAAGTFAIKYDASPPLLAALPSQTEVGHTTLNWTTSADAAQTRIVRSPGIGTAPASEVYAGPDHTFTDAGVTGGRTYTYTLTASDAAANTVTTAVDITAKPAPQASPATKNQPALPRLRWRRIKTADYYNVQLFRGDRKILSVWPRHNRFQLKRSWTFRGSKRVLVAGSYHWYVWPGYGSRSRRRYGKLIAHRRFDIKPAQAAQR